jgi:enoyl-CoA hydratase
MEYPGLLLEIAEKTAVISMDNPPGNSLSCDFLRALDSCFIDLIHNLDVKVIIVTGTGRVFATGADIAEMGKCQTAEQAMDMSRLGQQVFMNIENCPKPVIAAINGFCLGGGLELALSCHIRFASDHSVFGMPEIHLAMIPAFGGSHRLPRAVSTGRALQLVLSGDKILSNEALEIGLVTRIVPKEHLMEEAKKLATKLAGRSSASMRLALRSILRGSGTDINSAMEIEFACVGELYDKHDLIEGVHAYLEKRKPDFTDW